MADDLATAAVFGDYTQAQAARLLLQASGVPAFFGDETMAGGLFVVAAAVGGIKLQVPASRLDEALRILDERMPPEDDTAGPAPADHGDPDPGIAEDGGEPPPEHAAEPSGPDALENDLTLRERRAARLPRGVCIGFFCFPVMLLAFWRLIQVFVSDERLGPEYRKKALLAGVFILPLTCLGLMWLRLWVCGLF